MQMLENHLITNSNAKLLIKSIPAAQLDPAADVPPDPGRGCERAPSLLLRHPGHPRGLHGPGDVGGLLQRN